MSKQDNHKKVLLLGGAGFIGFHLASFIQKHTDHHITIADNLSRGVMDEDLSDLIKDNNIEFIEADFTKPESFSLLGKEYDQFYMLASIVGVDNTLSKPQEVIRVNSSLILNSLEWIKTSNVKKVLFTSTSENYAGTIDHFGYSIPTSEDIPLSIPDISHPRYTYAVTKILGEAGFLNYSKAYGFDCTIIRYHNVFGPRMGFSHVIPNLAQRFIDNNEEPFLMQGHTQTRTFCFISDAIRATVLAMDSQISNGEIYHIGAEDEITIETLIKTCGKYFKFSGNFKPAPTFSGSTERRCPDISKANNHFGYKPLVDWQEGLEITLEWYENLLNQQ